MEPMIIPTKPHRFSRLARVVMVFAGLAVLAACGESSRSAAPSRELTKEQFFAQIDSLTNLELADYIKEFESRYGLSAAAAGPVPAAPELPSLREQAALANGWLKERFDRLLPELMRREKIDMWLVICREHAEDPVYPTLMPQPNMFAWRLMMLVFFDRGGAAGVERISVNPYGSGAFNRE